MMNTEENTSYNSSASNAQENQFNNIQKKLVDAKVINKMQHNSLIGDIISLVCTIPVAILIMALAGPFLIILILVVQIALVIGILHSINTSTSVRIHQFKIYYDEIVNRYHADFSDRTEEAVCLKYLGKVEHFSSNYLECNIGDRAFVITDEKNNVLDVFPESYYYLSKDLLPLVLVPENIGMQPYYYPEYSRPVNYKP